MERYPILHKLETLRKLNSHKDWKNRDIHKLLYSEDMFVLAYEKIKSKEGNMTAGVDGRTIDGFSNRQARKLISEIRSEQYQPKPVRVVYIPKANGKLRRLGIPSTRDKVVQEVIRVILEAIYEPTFSDNSHGFRPNRSCHTALQQVQSWSSITWIIEGDIEGFFDNIDHQVLVNLLRKRIEDERFMSLIFKLLRAGYWDLTKNEKGESLAGTPQGGVVAPILANIYLDAFDNFITELQNKYEKGTQRAKNLEYRRLAKRRQTLAQQGYSKTEAFKETSRLMRKTPSVNVNDPGFVRLQYVRYADDWIIGLIGPKELAGQLKEEAKIFLKTELKLTLGEEKTRIAHTRTEETLFLGVRIMVRAATSQKQTTSTNGTGRLFKRRSTGWETVMKAPLERIIKRFAGKGFCTPQGEPKAKYGWMFLDDEQIIHLFSAVNRGILNYYQFVENWWEMSGVQHILRYSLVKTLAAKHKTTVGKIFKTYGKEITRLVEASDAKGAKKVTFCRNTNWTKSRNAFLVGSRYKEADILRLSYRLRSRSKLGKACCICGETEGVEMHHLRAIRKMTRKRQNDGFAQVMRSLNRKQIPVCRECHLNIHQGRYDGMRLKDLAYLPL